VAIKIRAFPGLRIWTLHDPLQLPLGQEIPRRAQPTKRPYNQRTKPPITGTGAKVGPTKSK